MRFVGRSVSLSIALTAGLMWCGTALAPAADPPPIGSPTDHFEKRRAIGTEGVLAFGGAGLDLKRVELAPPNDPGDYLGTTQEASIAGVSTTQASGFVEADLDTVTDDGAQRGSLQPGAAVAGFGVTSADCQNAGDFCLTWFRPNYKDADHSFNGFGARFGLRFPNFNYPDGDIAMATGTFDAAEGPSIVLAWVDSYAYPGGPARVKVAHVVADRYTSGALEGQVRDLRLDGGITTLGGAYDDPSLGQTTPTLAVGDFTKTGTDQVAVVWAPDTSSPTARQVTATMLGGGPGAGLQEVIPSQTFDAQLAGDYSAGSPKQISPGAAAIHDSRGTGDPFDHLVIGAGATGVDNLIVPKPVLGDAGNTFEQGGMTPSAIVVGGVPVNRTFSGKLASPGDLNGDGIDEIVSTSDSAISPDGNSHVAVFSPSLASDLELDGFYKINTPSSWSGHIETAVIDARWVKRQVIVPVPGKVDTKTMPQIALARVQNVQGQGNRPALQLLGLNADLTQTQLKNPDTGFTTFPLGGYTSGTPAVPRLTPMALDGRVELGDPVEGQYTQLEPSVVLNAPPTHFDILDGQAYDPNFCYAGNQYMVPPVCFFNSEYEREQTASTEVTSESTEDWAVSAKANADFSLFDVVDVGVEVRGGFGENFKEVGGSTTTDTVNVTVKALNTDKIYAIKRTYDTLEYPLYQPGSPEPSGYVLAETPHTVQKRWIDVTSPDAVDIKMNHQPGNILSYPENRTEAENPFISPTFDDNGDPVGPATFAQDEFELSDSSDYKYALTHERLQEDSAARQKDWNIGATVSAGGKVPGIVDLKLEVAGDYKNSHLVTTKTKAGDTTKLTSTMAGIDESFGETAYTVKPFAYWTANATLVLDYAVEPGVAPPGAPKTWWQQKYGSKPDLTLNLPRLLDYEEQAGISSDSARFISPDVSVLRGQCGGAAPLGNVDPGPGQQLCLTAQVENYSLKDQSGNTKVEFYDADPDVGGELLGTVDVGPVPARGSKEASLDWTPDARYAGTMPRIFARVDATDAISEVHENNNKGFRGYRAAAAADVALHAPSDVLAEVGDDGSLDVTWTDELAPTQPADHQWRVSAYPDDGGPPITTTVDGAAHSASIPDVPVGLYRVAVFAIAGPDSSPASHPSEPVGVSLGVPGAPTGVQAVAGDTAVDLSWDAPASTGGGPIESYRIREYRDPGQSFPQAPIDTTVAGDVTGLTLSGLTNDRPYRFTVQAVNAEGPGGTSDPSDAVTPHGIDVPPPTVALTKAPAEGSYSRSKVTIEFDAQPADAEPECVIDGRTQPCRSPLRLNDLEDGSHTIQVRVKSDGGVASTSTIGWNVDGVEPQASTKGMRKLIRGDDPKLEYGGSDKGGSGLAGFEIRSRHGARRGKFTTDPIVVDQTTESGGDRQLPVEAGATVCASVRSVDGAGNYSPWTDERCVARPYEESALRKEGKGWRTARNKAFSGGRALQTKRSGPSLSFLLHRTNKVKVLAGRCSACGKLAVEVRGHRRKVIDLSKTRRRGSRITVFNAKWPKDRDGRLRLISLGGGQVRVDGVAVWRSTK